MAVGCGQPAGCAPMEIDSSLKARNTVLRSLSAALQPCPCYAGGVLGVLGVIAVATLMGSDRYDIPIRGSARGLPSLGGRGIAGTALHC